MTRSNPFETMADTYDDWFDEHPAAFESEVEAVRAVLPAHPGAWVEIGVGTGRFASRLGIGLGVEPAAAMADRARRRGIHVLSGVAERLPLRDTSVDAVFFITSLCFVNDVDRAMAEAGRVLAPGGVVIVAFLPRDSAAGRAIASRPFDPFFADARLLAVSDVLAALQGAGLVVDRIVQTLTTFPAVDGVEAPSGGFDRGAFVVVRASRA